MLWMIKVEMTDNTKKTHSFIARNPDGADYNYNDSHRGGAKKSPVPIQKFL